MKMSMYQASVPPFTRTLKALAAILDKAQAHCEAKKIDPSVLLNFRLYPDMFNFTKQIHIAADQAKGCVARLAGQEPPKYEDNETSFAQLKDRIERTIAFINGFKPEQIDGTEDKDIKLTMGSRTMEFTGISYLQGFVTPNVYFHCATAYNILRHNGIEIGKKDFLG